MLNIILLYDYYTIVLFYLIYYILYLFPKWEERGKGREGKGDNKGGKG